MTFEKLPCCACLPFCSQFALEEYAGEMEVLLGSSKEEIVQALRRGSSCFARWVEVQCAVA